MYTLTFAPQALEDLAKLKKSEPAAFKKAGKLLGELYDHPKTGTGKPEALSGDRSGQWFVMFAGIAVWQTINT